MIGLRGRVAGAALVILGGCAEVSRNADGNSDGVPVSVTSPETAPTEGESPPPTSRTLPSATLPPNATLPSTLPEQLQFIVSQECHDALHSRGFAEGYVEGLDVAAAELDDDIPSAWLTLMSLRDAIDLGKDTYNHRLSYLEASDRPPPAAYNFALDAIEAAADHFFSEAGMDIARYFKRLDERSGALIERADQLSEDVVDSDVCFDSSPLRDFPIACHAAFQQQGYLEAIEEGAEDSITGLVYRNPLPATSVWAYDAALQAAYDTYNAGLEDFNERGLVQRYSSQAAVEYDHEALEEAVTDTITFLQDVISEQVKAQNTTRNAAVENIRLQVSITQSYPVPEGDCVVAKPESTTESESTSATTLHSDKQ